MSLPSPVHGSGEAGASIRSSFFLEQRVGGLFAQQLVSADAEQVQVEELPGEEQIQDPATKGMRASPSHVGQDVRVVAPGVFKSVCQHRHRIESTVGMDGQGERTDCTGQPRRRPGDPMEGVADDVTQ
jgi:hypothetical protein